MPFRGDSGDTESKVAELEERIRRMERRILTTEGGGGGGGGGVSNHNQLAGVTSDQHHARLHTVINAADHTFPGGTTNFLREDGSWQPPSGGGHTIEDEGTPLTQQTSLNFVGAGVTAADSGGKTVVTIPGGGGAGDEPSVADWLNI